MASKRVTFWPIATAVVGLLALLIALPSEWKGWAPGFLARPGLHLGLDLAGGTQLDFRISEEEITKQLAEVDAEIDRLQKSGGSTEQINIARAQKQSIQSQQSNLVEAIRTVLERRINSLGVSEATITPSYVGNERHLLVECPGVIDVQECIKVVGKTIQLEFKEEQTEATADFKNGIRANAQAVLRRITQSGSTLEKEGQDVGNDLGVAYQNRREFFRDQLPKGMESFWTMAPNKIVLKEGTITQQEPQQDGSLKDVQIPGIFIAEVLQGPTETGRTIIEATKAFAYLAFQTIIDFYDQKKIHVRNKARKPCLGFLPYIHSKMWCQHITR
jgi:hypothetical protein